MLIRLSGRSTYTPVELDNGKEDLLADGTNLIVVGWGTTSHGGPGSDLLLEVEVDVDVSCGLNPEEITPRMFCAGSEGKDSCQGDSGGPIIHKETLKQVGIVSFGTGCGLQGYPGVYAKVLN